MMPYAVIEKFEIPFDASLCPICIKICIVRCPDDTSTYSALGALICRGRKLVLIPNNSLIDATPRLELRLVSTQAKFSSRSSVYII